MAESTVQSIETSAPPDVVFDVASRLEEYPDWIAGVRSVEVLERNEDGLPESAVLVIDALVREVTTTIRYRYEDREAMSWSADPGEDVRELEGRYEFSPLDGGGTEIVYALRVDPGFTVPGFLRRQAEKQLVGSALRGLKRRAEQVAAGGD